MLCHAAQRAANSWLATYTIYEDVLRLIELVIEVKICFINALGNLVFWNFPDEPDPQLVRFLLIVCFE